jgi:hypothetical protein
VEKAAALVARLDARTEAVNRTCVHRKLDANFGCDCAIEANRREDTMNHSHKVIATAALALALGASSAEAGPLKIVTVGAPAVNCVFNPTCTITVNDSSGNVDLPFLATPGTVWLQSRTFTGVAGTPGAGLTGYEYRLSMTQAAGFSDCILGLVLDFGPITKLPYTAGTMSDIYVVTSGGVGTIGLKSAEQEGDIIIFEFDKPVCVPPAPTNTATTFFFGLASAKAPKAISAGMFAMGNPPYFAVDARVPQH